MTNNRQRSRTLEPLRTGRSAGTLRLQLLMEVQQRHEIGQRIKELRNASPQTNRSIADHVGVGERAVAQWIAGGGIAWENAKKVADLFEVDVQWLWSGRDKDATPDLFGHLNGSSKEQLDRIEWKLNRLLVAQGLEAGEPIPEGADPGRIIEDAEDVALADDVQEPPSPSETAHRETDREARRAAS